MKTKIKISKYIKLLVFVVSLSFISASLFCQTAEQLQERLRQQQRQLNSQDNRAPQQQTQTPAQQTQTQAPADDAFNWSESFSLSFGLELSYGNSRSTVGTYDARYSAAYKEIWDFNVSLDGAYGESLDQDSGSMEKDRSEHKVSFVIDRWFLNKFIAASYNTSLSSNEFSNIYIRWTNGLAIKLRPLSVWWMELTFTISPSVEYTKTYDLITRRTDWTVVYTAECDINFDQAQTVTLTNSFSFTPKFTNYKDNRFNYSAEFNVKFLKLFMITIDFSYDWTSRPPNDDTPVKKSDYSLSVKLGVNL